MRRYWKHAIVVVAGALVLAELLAVASVGAAPKGPATPAVTGAGMGMGCPMMAGWMGRNQKGQVGVCPMNGYIIKPDARTKKTWDRMWSLATEQHKMRWQLFEMLSEKKPNKAKIQAHMDKMQRIGAEMTNLGEQLWKSRRTVPAGFAAAAGCGAPCGGVAASRKVKTW